MNMDDLVRDYEHNHESVLCKATHAIGIPMIALSVPMLLVSPKRALRWFAIGWALQFAGHAAEGKPPKFFEGKEYFLAGMVWWLRLAEASVRSVVGRTA